MKPVQRRIQRSREVTGQGPDVSTWAPSGEMDPGDPDLHPTGTDDVKGSGHAGDKLDNLVEALVADAPGAVDEEHQVRFGSFANCGTDEIVLIRAARLNK